MKEIPLTQGYSVTVDDEDFEWLSQWSWQILKSRGHLYAKRTVRNRAVLMHRAILNASQDVEVDHKDGYGLNNCRSNLRLATHAENLANSKPSIKNTSGVRGVYWNKKDRRWHVQISLNGKNTYLGQFLDKHKAADVFDAACLSRSGEFARINQRL